MVGSNSSRWIVLLVCLLGLFEAEGYPVGITYLKSAVAKGAVCLDGSPPAYHLSLGSGSGAHNWIVLLEGGAWCDSHSSCLGRKNTRLGSSKKMVRTLQFSGMLGNNKKRNPDFYNWNKVKVRYCDGSSFTGDVDAVDPKTNLHYRGQRIFQAVVEDLLGKGMKSSKQVLFAGSSAGGLAAILHCDKFRSLLPGSAKVKCLSDAGYFINAPDITGTRRIQRFFENVAKTHGSRKGLPSSCTSRMSPGQCFFPQNVASHIRTPLFILNAAYDAWQIKNILAPGAADPHGTWHNCKVSINKCSSSQLRIMQGYRKEFLSALAKGGGPSSRGYFISSCYVHGESERQGTWLAGNSPRIGNTPIGRAIGDWYFGRKSCHAIDCAYPCNKSCKNRVYGKSMFDEEVNIMDV